jgi:hypothetical protein
VSEADVSSYTFDAGDYDANTGAITVKLNDTESGETPEKEVELDTEQPSIDGGVTFPSPDGTIEDQDPTIKLRLIDSPAGVEASSVDIDSLEDSDGNSLDFDELDEDDVNNGDDFEVTEDLSSEETYTVDWSADDEVGNTGNSDFDFTFDNSYNGPTSVSLEPEDGSVIGVDDDRFQLDITVNQNNNGDTKIDVGCYSDSDLEDDYDTGTIDDTSDDDEDDRTFTCDIGTGEYDNGDTIYIGLEDQAGNRYSKDDPIEASYQVDARAPVVQSLDLESTDVDNPTLSGDFDVSVDVDDDTDSTSRVEYYFGDSTFEGDGTALEWDGNGEYTIDTSDLESGSHTLHVRARDSLEENDGDAFHGYGSKKELDFSFNPDATKDIGIEAPDNLTVTAGDSENVDITVTNTGGAFISDVNVSASGFFADSGQIGQLRTEAEGFLTFEFNTSKPDLGSHTATIEAEDFSTSKEIGIDVTANQEQRSSVETKLDRFSTELESLRSNYTEVEQKVSGDRESNLTSKFKEYESVVKEARTAVQSDNYAEAKETLNSAQSKLEASKKSVSSNKEFVQSRNQRNRLIIGVVAVLVLLIASVGGFIYSERYEVDIGQAVKSDIPVDSLSGLKDRIKTIFTDEEDADEFEWSGFED